MCLSVENQALREKIQESLPKAFVRFHENGSLNVRLHKSDIEVAVEKKRAGWVGMIEDSSGNFRNTPIGALMDALKTRSVELEALSELISSEMGVLGKITFRTRIEKKPVRKIKAKAATPAKKRGRGRPPGSKNKPKTAEVAVVEKKRPAKVEAPVMKASAVVETPVKRGPGRPKGLKFPNGYKTSKEKAPKVKAPKAPKIKKAKKAEPAAAELDSILKA